jgi:hypothetical protein
VGGRAVKNEEYDFAQGHRLQRTLPFRSTQRYNGTPTIGVLFKNPIQKVEKFLDLKKKKRQYVHLCSNTLDIQQKF